MFIQYEYQSEIQSFSEANKPVTVTIITIYVISRYPFATVTGPTLWVIILTKKLLIKPTNLKVILKILFICTITMSCVSFTYYQCRYVIKGTGSYPADKEDAIKKISLIAGKFNLQLDKKASNADSISYYGPPYHYIQFIFERNNNVDSIEIKLNYDGRMASQKSTDRIYFGIKKSLDSLYSDRLKYTLIRKNYNP